MNSLIELRAQVEIAAGSYLRSGSLVTKLYKKLQLTDGTGAGQANKKFSPLTQPAIAQSTNTDYDLSGTLGEDLGNVVFTAVKALIVVAADANPGVITLFGGTNPFLGPLTGTTPALALAAGMGILLPKTDASGWAVTNASNDNFRIATAATTGTYSWGLLVIGI